MLPVLGVPASLAFAISFGGGGFVASRFPWAVCLDPHRAQAPARVKAVVECPSPLFPGA